MTKSELELLFKTHYAEMFRLAMSLLYDPDESKDVVSDVLAKLLDSSMTIKGDDATMAPTLAKPNATACNNGYK